MTRAVSLLGPALAYLVGIFVLGSVRFSAAPGHVSDKTAHFVVFGLLVLPMARALRYFGDHPATERLGRGALLSSLAGAALEAWQALLPHRSAELLDWVADTAGAFAVALVVAVVARLARGDAPAAPTSREAP